MTRHTLVVLLLCAVPITSCGPSGSLAGKSRAAVLSPGADVLAALERENRDCLQYRVERKPDGSEVWNADYVYFDLVREADGALVVDQKGVPLASGLLASEAVKWMDGRKPISGTGWSWRVMRSVQQVENGRVVRRSAFSLVEEADLSELLNKDRVARRS